ncbi:MAG: hypothetical protein JSS84_10160 [Bacteroidetes bacterium]|nr:hypothetical protein [Bacteroidota bacterium]
MHEIPAQPQTLCRWLVAGLTSGLALAKIRNHVRAQNVAMLLAKAETLKVKMRLETQTRRTRIDR